jgi:hypothetical protein
VTWAPNQVFADGARLAASTVALASMPARTFQFVAGSGLYVNAGGGNPAEHATQVGRRMAGFTISGKSWVSIRGFRTTHCEEKGIVVQNASSNVEVADNRSNLNFKYGSRWPGSTARTVARNAVSGAAGMGLRSPPGAPAAPSRATMLAQRRSQCADREWLKLFGRPTTDLAATATHRQRQTPGRHIQSASNDCVSIPELLVAERRSRLRSPRRYRHVAPRRRAWGNYRDGFSIEAAPAGTRLYNCIAVENGLTTNEFDLWRTRARRPAWVSDSSIF